MMIPITKQNFLTGQVYICYVGLLNRKIMARYVPPEMRLKRNTMNMDIGILMLHDFDNLSRLDSRDLHVEDAAYFFDAHCNVYKDRKSIPIGEIESDIEKYLQNPNNVRY